MEASASDEVLIRREGRAGRITMNRPKALNALTHAMVGRIWEALLAWKDDPAVELVLLDGAGDRGAVRRRRRALALRQPARRARRYARSFWREEYRLNALIGRYPKPYVAIQDGIVMGGGIGLSGHARHRIVTERSKLAMPETGIGLIPDVGGTWLLAHAPGQTGIYLGLTGEAMGAADAIYARFSDAFVPAPKLDALPRPPDRCQGQAPWPTSIAAFAKDPGPSRASRTGAATSTAPSAEQRSKPFWSCSRQLPGEWARRLQATLAQKSPKCPQAHAGRHPQCPRRSARSRRPSTWNTGSRCALFEDGEFPEGVRALIIDKDRKPNWSPPRLEEVTPELVATLPGAVAGGRGAGPASPRDGAHDRRLHKGPLAGMRVLDLSHVMAGPVCGLMLADMGADVIKVERIPDRRRQPADDARPSIDGESAAFMMMNRNKRGLALDLKKPKGQEVLKRLVKNADALIENYRKGTMEKLGLGYDALKAINPGLIYCEISGFGRTGPMASQGGFDLVTQGMSGLMSITGEGPGRPPVKVGAPITDITGGLLAAMGVCAAYAHKLKTGEGQRVDTSLFEAGIIQTYWQSAIAFATGVSPGPLGSAHPLSAPYQAFETRDGWITLGASNQKTWRQFIEMLDAPDIANDPRFADNAGRMANLAGADRRAQSALQEAHDGGLAGTAGSRRRAGGARAVGRRDARPSADDCARHGAGGRAPPRRPRADHRLAGEVLGYPGRDRAAGAPLRAALARHPGRARLSARPRSTPLSRRAWWLNPPSQQGVRGLHDGAGFPERTRRLDG